VKTKRIAIFYQGARTYGGTENYLENLFKSYDREVVDLTLISLGDWELARRVRNAGGKVLVLNFKWYYYPRIFKMAKLTKEEKFDLLVSQVMVANFYARLTSLLTKVPNLVVVHSDYEFDYPNGIKKLIHFLSELFLRNLTRKYIAVSRYIKDKLVSSGIKSEKIAVIYNGVDPEPFEIVSKPAYTNKLRTGRQPRTNPPAQASYGRAGSRKLKVENQIIVGSVGRLHYTKGYHNLIEAISYLKDLPIKLMIWGEGEEKKELEELIQKRELVGKVKLAGFEENLMKIYSQVDIYVQPSLSEGFGLTVVEAMLAARPVIVTPVGSLPELVVDGKTGLIAGDTNPESIAVAIKTLVENEDLAEVLAKEGQKTAIKRFSIEKWIKETEKVYRETAK